MDDADDAHFKYQEWKEDIFSNCKISIDKRYLKNWQRIMLHYTLLCTLYFVLRRILIFSQLMMKIICVSILCGTNSLSSLYLWYLICKLVNFQNHLLNILFHNVCYKIGLWENMMNCLLRFIFLYLRVQSIVEQVRSMEDKPVRKMRRPETMRFSISIIGSHHWVHLKYFWNIVKTLSLIYILPIELLASGQRTADPFQF